MAALTVVIAGCGGAPVAPRATSPAPHTTPAKPGPTPSPTAVCTPLTAVERWPLARRAAQLVVAPALDGGLGALATTVSAGVGGVALLGSAAPGDLRAQVDAADRVAATPLLVMADEEGGGVQRLGGLVASLPWPRAMAQTMSPAQVEAAATAVGRQMKALGVDVDLAPVLDVDGGPGPDSRNADGQRSFSADPAAASAYGTAFARGLRVAGVLAVGKHFPGLGGTTPNTDEGRAATLPLSTLERSGLLPFQAAIADGLPAVMVSHASVPGLTSEPASLSAEVVTGLLRTRLGFHGLVLTDSLSAGAITGTGHTVPDAAVAAVAAGADMVLFGSTLTLEQTRLLSPDMVAASVRDIVDALVGADQSARLPAGRLDDAVVHVLTAKDIDPCATR